MLFLSRSLSHSQFISSYCTLCEHYEFRLLTFYCHHRFRPIRRAVHAMLWWTQAEDTLSVFILLKTLVVVRKTHLRHQYKLD